MSNPQINKKVQNPIFVIDNNVIKYQGSAIQISNISKCEIAKEAPKAYPFWTFIALIAGIGLLVTGTSLAAIGFFAIVISGLTIYMIFSYNSKLDTFFILELNSGTHMLFSSGNADFLWEAEKELINCFY